MRKLLICLALILLTPAALAAMTGTRKFPAGGSVVSVDAFEVAWPFPQLKLEGKVYEGSPGLQIRGARGELLMVKQLPINAKAYMLLEQRTGQVVRLWILTAEELQELSPKSSGLIINTPLGTIEF
ncbi:hypothetical protein [Chitinilyticum aquatile]|uniref:hypothetical protein n=1 Tax=Chitinilyticum aquatile TaxID=362520 RepID=UPI0004288102|nr:hypothetical protein [Chitinilyticum aquatile]